MLPERLSTDLTSLNPGEDRLAVVVDADGRRGRRGGRLRRAPRAACATRPSSPTTRSRPGSTGRPTPPAAVAASRALDAQLRLQDGVAQALKRAATSTARSTSRPSRRGRLRRRRARRPPARRGEPREAADRGLHDRGQRRDRALPRTRAASRRSGACCARPSAGTASSRSRAEHGERLPATPDAARAPGVPPAAPRRRTPMRFPDLSLTVVKLLGTGEYARRAPGPRPRPLRPRRARLHALHRAQPPVPGPRHPAPAQGGARGQRPPYAPTSSTARAPLHGAGRRRDEGRAAGAQVRRRPAARRRIGEGSTAS